MEKLKGFLAAWLFVFVFLGILIVLVLPAGIEWLRVQPTWIQGAVGLAFASFLIAAMIVSDD